VYAKVHPRDPANCQFELRLGREGRDKNQAYNDYDRKLFHVYLLLWFVDLGMSLRTYFSVQNQVLNIKIR
jgi:hypothetical protein